LNSPAEAEPQVGMVQRTDGAALEEGGNRTRWRRKLKKPRGSAAAFAVCPLGGEKKGSRAGEEPARTYSGGERPPPPPSGEAVATHDFARGEEAGATRGSPWVNRVTTLSLRFFLGLTRFDPWAETLSGATS
jgi:hypothetical protein